MRAVLGAVLVDWARARARARRLGSGLVAGALVVWARGLLLDAVLPRAAVGLAGDRRTSGSRRL